MKEEPLDRTLWKRSGGDYGPDVRETGEELDDSRNYYTQSGSPNRSIKCSQGASRAEIVQSVTRLAAGWKVRGSNPSEGGGEVFGARPDQPWSFAPSSTKSAPGLFPWGKATGAWR